VEGGAVMRRFYDMGVGLVLGLASQGLPVEKDMR